MKTIKVIKSDNKNTKKMKSRGVNCKNASKISNNSVKR